MLALSVLVGLLLASLARATSSSSPVSRDCHTTTLLSDGKLFVHAGWTSAGESAYLNDTWAGTAAAATSTWSELSSTTSAHPGARDAHVAVALNGTTQLIFGGNSGTSSCGRLQQMSYVPPPHFVPSKLPESSAEIRRFASAESRLAAGFCNDLWFASTDGAGGVRWEALLEPSVAPGPRVRPSAVLVTDVSAANATSGVTSDAGVNGVYGMALVLFGGWPGPSTRGEYDTMLNELWTFSLLTGTWVETKPKLFEAWPAPRCVQVSPFECTPRPARGASERPRTCLCSRRHVVSILSPFKAPLRSFLASC